MSPFTFKNEMQLGISGTYKLAKRLDDLELKHLGQEVRKGLRGAELKSIVSKMSYTVKTHKPVGKIACRIIHSAAGSSFRGLSFALNDLFSPILSNLAHLCTSTDDVQKVISTASVTKNTVLMKVDVNDFYQSGSHPLIAEVVSNHFTGETRAFVRDALFHVLYYQYAAFDIEDCYRVVEGTGMGQGHSGGTSDLLFNGLMESTLLTLSRKPILGYQSLCTLPR